MSLADQLANAATAREQGDNARAISIYEQALEDQPKKLSAKQAMLYAQIYNNIGALQMEMGDVRTALSNIRASLDLAPGSVDTLANLALAKQRTGNTQGAVEDCLEVLTSEKGHLLASTVLAIIYTEEGAHEKVIEVLDGCLRHHPDQPNLLSALAEAHIKLGQLEKALDIRKRLLSIQPGSFENLFHFAQTLHHMGRLDEAFAAYESALAVNGDDPSALSNSGYILLLQNKQAEALERFRKVLDNGRLFPQAAWHMAYVLMTNGRRGDARAIVEYHHAHMPSELGMNVLLSRLDRYDGFYRRGLKRLKALEAVRLSGRVGAEYVLEMGMLYKANGDMDMAEGFFAKLRELGASSPALKDIVEKIEA